MHIKNLIRSSQVTLRKTVAACVLVCLIACNTNVVLADFLGVGNVTGTQNVPFQTTPTLILINEAGGPTGDLIIGDTGTGGLLADGVAPFIGTLMPLESDSVIIGNQPGSIGAANIEDFLGSDGNWEITNDLVVGHAGLGLLDLLNASGVGGAPASTIGGTTYVGGGNGPTGLSTAPGGLTVDPRSGEGIVRINGLGSRLNTRDLIVGGAGVGVVEASGRSVLNTQGIVEVGSTDNTEGAFGDGTITLTDLGTRWTANAPVTVGGLAGASHGKITIANQAVFQVDGVTTPAGPDGPGTLTINPRGRVELAGGTLRMLPQTTGNVIINNGLILGDGFIDGGINIGTTGQLRNAAGVANTREYLFVSEAVTNAGLIESVGGEMEFENTVTNTGDIVAQDAILRFRGTEASGSGTDLDNTLGRLILGDNSIVYGNITGPGSILATGTTFIFGDISFGPSPLIAALGSGDLAALSAPDVGFGLTLEHDEMLTIVGDLDLTGTASLAVDYVGDQQLQIGDVLSVLSVSGNITGDFANQQLAADGYLWDVDIIGGEVLVTAASLISSSAGDFDSDGDVDGNDFLSWQRDSTTPSKLLEWQTNYGSDSNSFSAADAVPEPSTLALALLTLACCPRRRRQS